MTAITRMPTALTLAACLAAMTACSAVPDGPSVGSLAECSALVVDGPPLEATLCREVAEAAFRAYPGPRLLADNVSVQELPCDGIADRSADAATKGQTCYLVTGNGVSGGRRIREGVFEGGTVLNVEGAVWRTADGALHTATTATSTGR